MKPHIPISLLIFSSLVGCSIPDISAIQDADIKDEQSSSSKRYNPKSTIFNEGEITPDEAIIKAKKVAKKYYMETLDIESAKILFHDSNTWFVDFTDTARVGRVCPWNEVVGINKHTGEAIINYPLD